ncbi:MAG: M23 family metallopeptidase [Propionibacteriaceae bacterium]|nr:M23 family metallopeptidase [Propionibacteriaceae bacterium]
MFLAMGLVPQGKAFAQSVNYPSFSMTRPVIAYTLSKLNDTPVYLGKSRNTRIGTIYASDEIRINDISNGWAHVTYPISGGRKSGFTQLWRLTRYADPTAVIQAKADISTFKRSDGIELLGSISRDDSVWIMDSSQDFTQVIYPISAGYKMGWISRLDLSRIRYGNSDDESTNNLFTPITGIDAGYVGDSGLDISAPKGTPVYAVGDGTLEYAEYGHTQWVPTAENPFDTPYSINIKLDSPVMVNGKTYPYIFMTHLSSTAVHKQDKSSGAIRIRKGQLIGYSGIGNGAPHLHISFYDSRDDEQRSL